MREWKCLVAYSRTQTNRATNLTPSPPLFLATLTRWASPSPILS